MVNLVLSGKTLDSFGRDTRAGTLTIPVSSLNLAAGFTESKDYRNRFVETNISAIEPVVLVRMPRVMYDRFLASAKDGRVTLPTAEFARDYANLADLDAHIAFEGNTATVNPAAGDAAMLKEIAAIPTVTPAPVLPETKQAVITPLLTPQGVDTWHNEWAFFTRSNTGISYDYCIGRITPNTWSVTGNSNMYYAPQEREYYLGPNRKEAIEIVVNYDHYTSYPTGTVKLFPTIYDDHSAIVPLSQWESSGAGIIQLNPATFPHSYGYHVQIYNGKYYITFEDMNTLQWFSQYIYNDQDNPSTSFTEFSGSSEFFQHTSPITDSFYAVTAPVIDEWTRVAGGSWMKPRQVWSLETQTPNENFVHINWFWGGSNNQELVTESYVWSGWA